MTLLGGPSYPAVLSRELELTRSNVSNHLTCLLALVDVTLGVDEHAPCVDSACTVPGCCGAGADA